jgi:hypothetical protein
MRPTTNRNANHDRSSTCAHSGGAWCDNPTRRDLQAGRRATGAPTLIARIMRLALPFALLLASCAAPDGGNIKPVFNGPLTYPKTEIQVSNGMKLVHEAGALDSEGRPYVGTPKPRDVPSKWSLRTDNQAAPLMTALSNLTDPSYSGEFEAYNRENDRITVYESDTGSTILIVEDRSPAYPNKDYTLFRRLASGKWSTNRLQLEPYLPTGGNPPLDFVFPQIIELRDTRLACTSANGTRWVEF